MALAGMGMRVRVCARAGATGDGRRVQGGAGATRGAHARGRWARAAHAGADGQAKEGSGGTSAVAGKARGEGLDSGHAKPGRERPTTSAPAGGEWR